LALGLLAAFWSALSGDNDETLERSVVVAATEIRAGAPIVAGQLRLAPWPSEAVPAGSFAKIDDVVGRVARQPIVANEPVLEARLAQRNAKGGLSSIIAPGMRAISVRVDEVIGVAGFAQPGGYVDVMVSTRDASSAPFSKIVLSRVKLVAAEQETTSDPTQPKVVRAVTLELGPEDAEKLDLARNIGTLSLVLRNEMDSRLTVSRGARLNDILPGAGVAAVPAPAPAPPASSAPAATVGTASSVQAAAPPAQPVSARATDRVINAYGAEEIRGGGSSGVKGL